MLNSTHKREQKQKNGDKDGKALYTLMKNAAYSKKIENLREKIDVRLVSNEKDYLKWTSRLSCMSKKMFDNNLVATQKNKVTLRLNKPAYVGMYILDLIKVLMYDFHYDNIKINMATGKKSKGCK